ncbi:hypothetical protein GBF38_022595 [Nibea albiflora]|uniref:Uncharacterized protein n=1 Tax=Nibea albiflora TaxID=240163 RepID=A0ACB7F0T2_NIBAL|nr:hypothetical protein GBF38_022595 [Nibea albiflora]
MAPVLGLPDYHQPFHLYVHERDGFHHWHSGTETWFSLPFVVCYSFRVTPVAVGMPSCLRAVAAVAILINKSYSIVLAHDCVVHIPHAVSHILNIRNTTHEAAPHPGYEAVTLSSPHITLKHSSLLVDTDDEHNCIATIDMYIALTSTANTTPNSDMVLNSDGSASRPSDNIHLSGYAVVN